MLPGLTMLAGFDAGGSAGSFTIEASETDVSKTGSTTGGSKTLTAGPVTVTPHGGSGSPTYVWSQLSGDVMTITAPTAASTSFSATLPPNGEKTGTFRCTVTDGSGAVATVDIAVELELVSFA